MPDPTTTRQTRRRRILDLVQRRKIRSQNELQELLAADGHDVNQATLSRDLRGLGLRKGPDGYELPEPSQPIGDPTADLERAVRAWLLGAVSAQNQVVLRTPPSGAQPLARALDTTPFDDVVGTLAGDDTVLVICRTAREASRLTMRILEMKGEEQ